MLLRSLSAAFTGLALICIGFIGAMTLSNHARTGRWEVPSISDVVEVLRMSGGVDPEAARVIYLHPDGLTVRPGRDDSSKGLSQVLASSGVAGARAVPAFSGRRSGWRKIVRCVQRGLAAYDVTVTTERPPPSENYILVAVGGRATDIGISPRKSRTTAGLAPLRAGQPIPRAVVYAFSATLGNAPRRVCDTILHEVGHAYGLEHVRSCKDIMGTRRACGRQRFVDGPKTCGERRAQPCKSGATHQNSHAALTAVLGERRRSVSRASSPQHQHQQQRPR